MTEFSQVFKERGYYLSNTNEIKRIDLLLDFTKCQKELNSKLIEGLKIIRKEIN